MADVWHDNGKSQTLRDDELRQAATGMLHARRSLRGTLPGALIHDVPLEMLLSAYLHHPGGVAVHDLTIDQTVPENSARRWLAAIVSEDLVVIDRDMVMLSQHGSAEMERMLTSVVRSQRAARLG